VYVLLATQSPDLPAPGGFDSTLGGKQDLYLARLSADGSTLLFATYLGGSGSEDIETHGLAVAADGSVYATGHTTSPDFPATEGAWRTARDLGPGEVREGFVAHVSPSGRLLAATYVGGRDGDAGEGIALDAGGFVYLTGGTSSPDFPVTSAPDAGTGRDLFLVKLEPSLAAPVYSTRIGGTGFDTGRAAAVDAGGRVAVTGHSQALDWPSLKPVLQGRMGEDDAVVVLLRRTADRAGASR
jgi:hypothetical protein